MSKLSFDYSKWDRLDISDDEDSFHPGLDKNLNIRVNRMTRDQKEDAIDFQKTELEEKGEFDKAEKLEHTRPLHQGNVCRIVEERTIINRPNASGSDKVLKDCENWITAEYTSFITANRHILEMFTGADWEKSNEMLLTHGNILFEEYANSYFMLAALDEEMTGNREKVKELCHQGQIISQITQLAVPVSRPPCDLVPRFFERFEKEECKAAFHQGVDNFVQALAQRAVQKKAEAAAQDAKRAEQEAAVARGELQKCSLVEGMYQMTKEQRLQVGPGGLDPVEVFESLPQGMQTAFKTGDVEKLQQTAEEMDEAEFDKHLQRCINCGLWKDT